MSGPIVTTAVELLREDAPGTAAFRVASIEPVTGTVSTVHFG
jgi:hypothetical protein